MRIISYSKGVPIKFGRESNVETIFGIDENNQVIQNLTFNCYISPDKDNFCVGRKKYLFIEKGYLFYSFRYQISFGHYMCQTVPFLFDFKQNYNGFKLLVPSHHNNLFQQRILELAGIPNDQIILLDDETTYEVFEFANRPRFPSIPDFFTDFQIKAYQMIRQSLQVKPNLSGSRKVYLKRDSKPNEKFGNTEIGILRVIQNEDQLIEHLKNRNFEIIWLGDKSVDEKSRLLSNIDILITPWGSNCFNLIFSNSPKRMFMFGNNHSFGGDYFKQLSEALNNSAIEYRCKYYNIDREIIDPLNSSNASFKVELCDFDY